MTEDLKHFMSHSQDPEGYLIVQIKDRFDEKNYSPIQEEIENLIKNSSSHLILDLNNVKSIRSAGLRVILSLAKLFQNTNKNFVLLYSENEENNQVAQILEVSGFTKIIPIFSSKESAVKYCKKPTG